ncbi:MAG: hypothetical protein WD049_09275 [Candidatus Paceibacterota bacterium]
MKTIDLANAPQAVAELFDLAAVEALIVRTADGKIFAVSELSAGEEPDDFEAEVALTRRNESLRALLAERSREAATHSLDDVRRLLGLTAPG